MFKRKVKEGGDKQGREERSAHGRGIEKQNRVSEVTKWHQEREFPDWPLEQRSGGGKESETWFRSDAHQVAMRGGLSGQQAGLTFQRKKSPDDVV